MNKAGTKHSFLGIKGKKCELGNTQTGGSDGIHTIYVPEAERQGLSLVEFTGNNILLRSKN